MPDTTPRAGEEPATLGDAATLAAVLRTALADPIHANFLTARQNPVRPPAEPSNAAAGGAGA